MAKLEIEIGQTLEDAGHDFIAAWRAAEAGRPVEGADRISFQSWEAFSSALTPKRIELIKHLRREPAVSIRALARSLERDVKHVHADVTALVAIGLIEKDKEGGLVTEVDEIATMIKIAA